MAVFIKKGDVHLSLAQANRRGLAIYNLEKAGHVRAALQVLDPDRYGVWARSWINDNQINETNNIFNLALERYRKAVSRLSDYRLSVGKPERRVEEPTGTFDDEGAEVMSVWVIDAIPALPATVEGVTYADDGTTATVEQVANPVIVADDAERSAAQATIDATPADVREFSA
jgi:hypothetical protein